MEDKFALLCFTYHHTQPNRFDPLWNSLVVGGFVGDIPYLATVGMIGTSFADTNIATGFGQMLARPLFREVDTTTLDEAAAVELMHKALKVCYYRDKQSINKFQMARITKQGIAICEPFSLETNWEFKVRCFCVRRLVVYQVVSCTYHLYCNRALSIQQRVQWAHGNNFWCIEWCKI